MTEREKIHSGDIYWPSDPEIMTEQLAYLDLMDEYNNTPRRLQDLEAYEPFDKYCTDGLDLRGKHIGVVGHGSAGWIHLTGGVVFLYLALMHLIRLLWKEKE